MVKKVYKKKNSLKITCTFFLIFSCILQNFFSLEIPKLNGRVNDYANIIKSEDEQEITNYLSSLENSTGIQIAVLTIPTLEGENIDSFGFKVADEWKLGQKEKDNGALLTVALAERQIRIDTGYGLESSLTDAKCGLIIRNVIAPEFKNGEYSKGILNGVKNMGGIVSDDETLVDQSVSSGKDNSYLVGIVFMIFWLLFIFCIIVSRGGRGRIGNPARNHIITNYPNGRISGGPRGPSGFSGGGGGFGGGGSSGGW